MERHAGDLGNIEANLDGVANFEFEVPAGTTLFGDDSIFHRSIVIHELEDNLGKPKNGAAGIKIACGTIQKQKAGIKSHMYLKGKNIIIVTQNSGPVRFHAGPFFAF